MRLKRTHHLGNRHAPHLNPLQVGHAVAQGVGVVQKAQFHRLKAHGLGHDRIHGKHIGRRCGRTHRHRISSPRAIALQAHRAIDDPNVRLEILGQADQVHVEYLGFAGQHALGVRGIAVHLDAILFVQRSHDHVLLRQRNHAHVVSLGHGHRDGARTFEHHARHPHGRLDAASHVNCGLFPPRLLMQIDQANRHRVFFD